MAGSKTETPNSQSSLKQWNSTRWERFKYTLRGSFLGLAAGTIFSFVVPKDLIRQNKFLNHWIQPDHMTPNIYPASNSALFAWIGAIGGGVVDIVRGFREPGNEQVNKATLSTCQAYDVPQENEKTDSFTKQLEQEQATKAATPPGQNR